MSKKNLALTAVVISVAIIAFLGGMQFQKSRRPSFSRSLGVNSNFPNSQGGMNNFANNQQGNGGVNPGFINNQNANQPVSGSVSSKDNTGLTLKTNDGNSKIVIVTSDTKVVKTEASSLEEIKSGTKVTVSGTSNSDGSFTAKTISVQ